jgi:hypothetical protein
MTAAPVAVRAPELARTASVLGGASAVLHGLLLDPASLAALVSFVLGLACLPCAARLWRAPTAGAWRTAAVLDATMLVVHLTPQPGAHAMHSAGASAQLAHLALGIVVVQLMLAGAAALRR